MKWKWKAGDIKLPDLRLRYRLLLYAAAIIFVALSMIDVIGKIFSEMVGPVLYALAACTLFASCYYLTLDIKYGVMEKVKPRIQANPFTNRVVRDYRYRTVVFAVPGLLMNMVFAIFNGVIGVMNGSAWFGSLSAYYIFLSVMRFGVVWYNRRVTKSKKTQRLMQDEILIYQNCGILFIFMTIALGGAVVLLVNLEGGKHYPGYTIFAVAAYTFYKIIVAVINVVKAGKLRSPILMTIRNIGYIDACVSILSLQTAMFASFGKHQPEFMRLMNALTGLVVCIMVFVMGIRCICTAKKMKQELAGGIVHDSYTCSRR